MKKNEKEKSDKKVNEEWKIKNHRAREVKGNMKIDTTFTLSAFSYQEK